MTTFCSICRDSSSTLYYPSQTSSLAISEIFQLTDLAAICFCESCEEKMVDFYNFYNEARKNLANLVLYKVDVDSVSGEVEIKSAEVSLEDVPSEDVPLENVSVENASSDVEIEDCAEPELENVQSEQVVETEPEEQEPQIPMGNMVEKVTENIYRCAYCSYTGKYNAQIICHIKFTHKMEWEQRENASIMNGYDATDKYNFKLKRNKTIRFAKTGPKIRSYECYICRIKFFNEAELKTHAERHMKPFMCHVCGTEYKRSTSAEKCHNGTQHVWRLKCNVCNMASDKSCQSIKQYWRPEHQTGPSWVCQLCQETFPNEMLIRHHVRGHNMSWGKTVQLS